MRDMGKRAYVYAKACGMIGKSFVGRGIPRLRSLDRLQELDHLVFSGETRELPGQELLRDLERRVIGRAVKQILAIVASYSKTPESLVRLLRAYEYADVKSLLNHVGSREAGPPVFTDIKPFETVHWAAYPDLAAMFRDTEFAWIAREDPGALSGMDNILLQAKLDRQYYGRLWDSFRRLAGKDRKVGEFILGEEISLRNCMWALRLRCYYGLSPDKGRIFLLDIPLKSGCSTQTDALAALGFPLDDPAPWGKWPRKSFLNPWSPGEPWTPDPRFFQNAASRYLYRLALRFFRRQPFSLDTAFCFIKLKQFEEDLLTSVAEGLGLGISSGEILKLLEAET
jgi:vacuolar-type H+-ATPase subunit C/Vma6